MRVPRVAVRPIVLPVALPTVPRVAVFGSRMPVVFSAVPLVVLFAPIVLPIRDGISDLVERWFVADCFFVVDIDGSLLSIYSPIPRFRWVRSDELLLFTLSGVDSLFELTAGCFAFDEAEEFRAPMKPPIREVLSERAAGCSAPLGTDGLVVLILLPMREVRLELMLLLVFLVERFVITLLELLKPKLLLLELLKPKLLLLGLLTLDVPLLELLLFVTTLCYNSA